MMRKANPDTDQITRSFLQKTVRRGNFELTKKAIAYLSKNGDFDWLRKRLAVVTFEECWPYGLYVTYEKHLEIIEDHYLKIAKAVKNKNATGLGSLAYAYSKGDDTVLCGDSGDKSIKIISEAIKRPKDFWNWVKNQALHDKQAEFVEMAHKGFKKAGWPWDRAFAQAAAYLAITTSVPKVNYSAKQPDKEFPFWVGIDKHTREGKPAIRKAAKQIGFNSNKALWLSFYFESAKCNEIENSPWWEKEINWRMKKNRLELEEALEIWKKLKPIIIELLEPEALKLKKNILNVREEKHIDKQMSIFERKAS